MSVSPVRQTSGRVHLGSPSVSVSASPAYLRHRVAAERASLARRRAARWRRLLLALLCGLLYFAIGRDLVAVAVAKKNAVSAQVRHDAQTLTKDLEQVVGASHDTKASEFTSPAAFTTAAAAANSEDPSDVDAWLSE